MHSCLSGLRFVLYCNLHRTSLPKYKNIRMSAFEQPDPAAFPVHHLTRGAQQHTAETTNTAGHLGRQNRRTHTLNNYTLTDWFHSLLLTDGAV